MGQRTTKKLKHVMRLFGSREFLEKAADNAILSACRNADGKRGGRVPAQVAAFVADRPALMDRLERMVRERDWGTKTYRETFVHNCRKKRRIVTTEFYPWSILFTGIKMVLDPIVRRVSVYDSSAGITGESRVRTRMGGHKDKGQVFAGRRVGMFLRRYRDITHVVDADCAKFYESTRHSAVLSVLRDFVEDEDFIRMVERVVLDYRSDVEEVLEREHGLKLAHCRWAERVPFRRYGDRGVTIGGCDSQDIGALVLMRVDRVMKERYGVRAYHRHCDDIIMGAGSQEEGERLLNALDREMNALGFTLKHTSFVAPLERLREGVTGRRPDYC